MAQKELDLFLPPSRLKTTVTCLNSTKFLCRYLRRDVCGIFTGLQFVLVQIKPNVAIIIGSVTLWDLCALLSSKLGGMCDRAVRWHMLALTPYQLVPGSQCSLVRVKRGRKKIRGNCFTMSCRNPGQKRNAGLPQHPQIFCNSFYMVRYTQQYKVWE